MTYYDRDRDGYKGSESRDRWRLSATPPASDKLVRDPHTGRYTRTPPARLPELDQETYRSSEDLRGGYFERVPPVRPRPAFVNQRPDDLNSRGEEDRSDNSDDAMPPAQPYAYAPPQPYASPPYGQPGQIYYPAPMMVPAGYAVPGAYMQPQPAMYPQPVMQMVPQPQPAPQPQPKSGGQKKVRYDDRTRYYSESPRRERSNPRYVYEPKRTQPSTSRFSYIDTQPQQDAPSSHRSEPPPRKQYLIPTKNKPKTLDSEATDNFQSRDELASRVLESLVREVLHDQLIPDLLIEVVSEKLDNMSKDHPYYIPSFDSAVDVLDEAVPQLIRELVVDATKEMVTDYLDTEPTGGDMEDDVVERLLEEAVRDGIGDAVREAVQEMAEGHLQKASAYDVATDIMNEYIAELMPDLLKEVDDEIDVEHVFDTEVLHPVVADIAEEVAVETLEYYSAKAFTLEQREIQTQGRKRLLDGMVLNHLLATIAMAAAPPGQDEEVAAMNLTETAMLTILLEQTLGLISQPALTIDNKPVRRHHERTFTEVALDVLTEELCATLDEDMADYDDYEQGLWNPQHHRPPEWALYTT